MADEALLTTMTGDVFQPVRLHYQVLDHGKLLQAFAGLRCVARDPTQPRRVWLYDFEAKKVRLPTPCAQIPKHLRPIVIGSIFLRTREEMLLDLRSVERALAAIPFFDRHIPRNVARVAEAEVVNKLFPATGNQELTPDCLFDQQPSVTRHPDAEVRRITELVAGIADPQERLRIALEDMQTRSKEPLPEIERLPVHYYEDGLAGFENALKFRQIVAMQHWLGNAGYSLLDVIPSVVHG